MNTEEPEAYKIGDQPFLGLTIYLGSRPLIPRPETEWWTEQLLLTIAQAERLVSRENAVARQLKDVSHGDGRRASKFSAENYACPEDGAPLRLLDLCAGSGAIGCAALKYLPNAEVYFGEIDPAHEATILKNIRENNLDESCAYIGIGDLFAPFGDTMFDIIACNPPYIPSERVLDSSVADYEPALALRSGADGLDLIRRIALELPHRLNQGGEAWIECDTSNIDAAALLFQQQDFSAQIRVDQYNAPRVLTISYLT